MGLRLKNASGTFTSAAAGGKQTQPVSYGHIRPGRHVGLFQVVQGCAEEQVERVVHALRTVDDDLSRNDGVFGVQQQGLLRRQMPLFSETIVAIASAEFPE